MKLKLYLRLQTLSQKLAASGPFLKRINSIYTRAFSTVCTSRGDPSAITVCSHVVLFLALLGIIFANNEVCLLYQFDGNQWEILFDLQRQFHTPFTQAGADSIQGSFDTYYPVFREYLLPHAFAMLFGFAPPSRAFSYFVYSVFLTLTCYAFARSIGIGRGAAALGGMVTTFLLFPVFLANLPLLYPLFQISPHVAQGIGMMLLILTCFWAIQDQAGFVKIALLLAPAVLTIATAISLISITVLMAPPLAVYCFASLFSEPRKRYLIYRAISGGLAVAAPLALGILNYIYGLSSYTAFYFFSNELDQDRATLRYASIIYGPGYAGVTLLIAGIIGALVALKNGSRRLRVCALSYLLSTLIFQILAFATVTWAVGYHGPSPIYFEIFFLPLSAIFAAYAVYVAFDIMVNITFSASPNRHKTAHLIMTNLALAAAGGYLLLWNFSALRLGSAKSCPYAGFSPLKPTVITERLKEEISLHPGDTFRGMAATLTGYQSLPSVNWFDLFAYDGHLAAIIGNDHRTLGLWKYQIPTLIQYNTYISPQYYVLFSRLLDRPQDRQLRNIVFVTQPNERILKLWGVRFIISDFDLPFGDKRVDLPIGKGQEPLRLVELDNPNIGNYSPTKVSTVDNFRDALEIMRNINFEGRDSVVTMSKLSGPLERAADTQLVLTREGFRVRAKSPSRSVLVLPVQYSHCWSASGEGKPNLFRANFAQLGVEFNGTLDIALSLNYGPILEGKCRLDDLKDMNRFGIRSAELTP